jgi:hypothetical protein
VAKKVLLLRGIMGVGPLPDMGTLMKE